MQKQKVVKVALIQSECLIKPIMMLYWLVYFFFTVMINKWFLVIRCFFARFWSSIIPVLNIVMESRGRRLFGVGRKVFSLLLLLSGSLFYIRTREITEEVEKNNLLDLPPQIQRLTKPEQFDPIAVH